MKLLNRQLAAIKQKKESWTGNHWQQGDIYIKKKNQQNQNGNVNTHCFISRRREKILVIMCPST